MALIKTDNAFKRDIEQERKKSNLGRGHFAFFFLRRGRSMESVREWEVFEVSFAIHNLTSGQEIEKNENRKIK